MLDARHRPRGQFFYWLVSVLWVWGIAHAPVATAQTAPATTRVSDVVYRADSTPASGVVLISWPALATADGKPVAAGSTSVALDTGGAFNADLVPNAGANPAGAYYTVVFLLDDVVPDRILAGGHDIADHDRGGTGHAGIRNGFSDVAAVCG